MPAQNIPLPADGLTHEESPAPKLPGEEFASGERPKSGKSRMIVALVMMLLLLCVAVWLTWFMFGSKNTANVRVKKQQEQKEGAERDAELNAQIASLRQAMTATAPVPGAATEKGVMGANGAKSGNLQPGPNLAGTLAPPRQLVPLSSQEKSGEKGAEQDRDPSALMSEMSAHAPSHRNPERSIRFAAPTPTPSVKGKELRAEVMNAESTVKSTSQPLAAAPVNTPAAEKPSSPLTKATAPKFGAMLPVQLMGVLYTLRQGSLARLQLMRDVRGVGWQLKRGTVFVGEVRESVLDRAYIQIKGYIDPDHDGPDHNGFVALGGEILGSDGASGMRGKRHKPARAWTRVLDRLANAAIQTAQNSLGRNQAIIIGGDPYGIYRDTGILGGVRSESGLKEFVEVAAGSVGFVLVTDLPPITRRDQQSQTARLPTGEIGDAELAEILESDDPGRLRAALPRMSPPLKSMAEQVLREIEADKN